MLFNFKIIIIIIFNFLDGHVFVPIHMAFMVKVKGVHKNAQEIQIKCVEMSG
jgi:hypothetical protein